MYEAHYVLFVETSQFLKQIGICFSSFFFFLVVGFVRLGRGESGVGSPGVPLTVTSRGAGGKQYDFRVRKN